MCAKVCGPDQPSEPRLNRQLQLFPERNRGGPGVANVGRVLAPSADAGGPSRTAVGPDESSGGGEERSCVTEPTLVPAIHLRCFPGGPMLRKASTGRSTGS